MMKYLVLIITISSLTFGVQAQQAFSISDADSLGIDIPSLDSLYKSGIHSDASKAVFAGQQQEYIQAYYAMLHELSTYLNQNDFKWGGQTRCFNRIYFAEDGSIDFFLYKFKEGEITAEQQSQFATLLGQFIQSYKFALSKDVKFAQCSPVNYRDPI
ncbi:hypothetical protein [Marinoscillum sp.]|uniref:hypothetical protein n=1 Tax=Marinoscillum sp. TaxID=2024838 RepID=UPI003BAC2F71